MLVCDRTLLEDEINRVYTEHYSSCNTKAVHDFYRAVIRRVRRYTCNGEPEIISASLRRAEGHSIWLLTVLVRLFGHRFQINMRLPKEICDSNCICLDIKK